MDNEVVDSGSKFEDHHPNGVKYDSPGIALGSKFENDPALARCEAPPKLSSPKSQSTIFNHTQPPISGHVADTRSRSIPEFPFYQFSLYHSSASHRIPWHAPNTSSSIKSVFENKAEPEFIDKTIKSFIHTGLLDFTETDKVLYKVA